MSSRNTAKAADDAAAPLQQVGDGAPVALHCGDMVGQRSTLDATQMAALMGANIIKVKPPTAVISLEAAKKSYEKIDGSTMAKRVEHVMQCAFNGRRVVVFSGGEAKDLDGVFEEVRGLRDGGANGSIIGRNTFQRPKEVALEMLNKIIDIYLGKA